MARPKNIPTRADLNKLPLDLLRALLKDAIEAERAKTKAEKIEHETRQRKIRDLIGAGVLAVFAGDELTGLLRKIVPAATQKPDELALFSKWLEPDRAVDSGAPQGGALV